MAQGRGGGPKPRPHYLKIVKGTVRKGRLKRSGSGPASGRIDPPDFLSAPAIAEWQRLAPEFTRLGYLTPLDRAVFAAFCQSYGRWIQAEVALTEASITTRTKNGFEVQSPLLGIARRCAADTVKFAAELGLSPISRLRLQGVQPPAPENDPSSRYFD